MSSTHHRLCAFVKFGVNDDCDSSTTPNLMDTVTMVELYSGLTFTPKQTKLNTQLLSKQKMNKQLQFH